MSVGTQLSKAADALKSGEREKAAEHVAAAWRERPAVELLELACALAPPPALQGKNGKATIEALAEACRQKPDPRTSRALETLFRDLPFTADSSKPVWREAFKLAAHLKDPRFVELARTLPPTWKAREAMTAWVGSQLTKAVAPFAKTPVPDLDAETKRALATLTAAVPAPKKPTGGGDASALLAQVYARPDDDDTRRVLADALLEQGDPRGEFIQLQLKAAPTPADEKRWKQLLKANEDRWLDGLERFMTKQRTFTRGFVSAAKVIFKNPRDAEVAAPLAAWGTLEELTFGEGSSSGSHEWGQTIPAAMPALRSLGGLRARGVQNLLDAPAPWTKLDAIQGCLGDFQVWQQLTTTARLPALRTVTVSGVDLAWLRRAPPPTQWMHLAVDGGDAPEDFVAMAHGLKNERVTILTREGRWAFTRDEKSRLTKLRVEVTFPNRVSMAALELNALPKGSLTAFDADAPELHAAAKRLLGEGNVAPAPVEARTLGNPFAIGVSGARVLWADHQGVVDDAGTERITARWSAATFTADGRFVVGLAGGQLEVFDTSSGARIATHKTSWASHPSLSVSRDGQTIAIARSAATLIHCAGEESALTHKGTSQTALSADGLTLAREVSKTPDTWLELDAVGKKGKARKLEGVKRSVATLAFSPDGAQLAAATRDGQLVVFAVATGAHRVFTGVPSPTAVCWSPDGARLAVAGHDASAIIEIASGKPKPAPAALTVAWGADGRAHFGTTAPHRIVSVS